MRKALGLSVGLALLGLLAAPAEAKTELRVVIAYYSAATEGVFAGMAKDFEAKHPDVAINQGCNATWFAA